MKTPDLEARDDHARRRQPTGDGSPERHEDARTDAAGPEVSLPSAAPPPKGTDKNV